MPDFRLDPDPYIGIEEDREKGRRLLDASVGRTFAEMLHHYYDITAEDPPDLARHWTAHALAEAEIAERVLREAGLLCRRGGRALLDLGCSTGGLLIAAQSRYPTLIGVDVAFRWLVIGSIRLREAGVRARLVCANAEALPFPERRFDVVTATDLAEHLRDPRRAVREAVRVLRPEGRTLWTLNNRYAPLPDPHVRLWGLGCLPRRWQARYVAWRRPDLHRFHVRPRAAGEMRKLFARGGFRDIHVGAAPLHAPHFGRRTQRALTFCNHIRQWPVIAGFLNRFGPRLWIRARR